MITNQEEIKLKSGQTLSIQKNNAAMKWEVAVWNSDDSNSWYKEYNKEEDARKEFNRWKDY